MIKHARPAKSNPIHFLRRPIFFGRFTYRDLSSTLSASIVCCPVFALARRVPVDADGLADEGSHVFFGQLVVFAGEIARL
jgi:hypothetical protein